MSFKRVPIIDESPWQYQVEDKDLTTSPGSPAKGDRYIMAGIGGGWSGGTINDITYYDGSIWIFVTPVEGFITWIKDENKLYNFTGTVWTEYLRETKDNLENNIMLNAFRIAINGSLTKFNMVDGIMDEFEDESGVDTGVSTNEDYDATDDYYSPTVQVATIDSNTKLMLHLNNNVTDDSPSSHTVTNNNVTFNNIIKKWGYSGVFNGTTAYLFIPDSVDWDIFGSNSDDWTIDFWIKKIGSLADKPLLTQREDVNNRWSMSAGAEGGGSATVSINLMIGGAVKINVGTSTNINDGNWHHVAFCKIANEYSLYIDGTQEGYTLDNDTDTFAAPLRVGSDDGINLFVDGYMEELRIQHSNIFAASPVVGLTDTIIVPTEEYTVNEIIYNMTLVSNSTEAEEQPDDSRLVLFEEDVDAIILNTDLKAYVSRDDGANWVQAILADEGNYASSKRILTGNADISGQAADKTIKWKIESLNNKNLKLHGVGELWN